MQEYFECQMSKRFQGFKIIRRRRLKSRRYGNRFKPYKTRKDSIFDQFLNEGGEDIYYYIDRLGLSDESEMIVLSSRHHFFYDPDDLITVKAVVNLKPLNCVRKLREFLAGMTGSVPSGCYFIGNFYEGSCKNNLSPMNDNNHAGDAAEPGKTEGGTFFSFQVLNIIFKKWLFIIRKMIKFGKNGILTKKALTLLLEGMSFKMVDMTEMNGLTYFCAQKVSLLEQDNQSTALTAG
jgi:hypothetical protein